MLCSFSPLVVLLSFQWPLRRTQIGLLAGSNVLAEGLMRVIAQTGTHWHIVGTVLNARVYLRRGSLSKAHPWCHYQQQMHSGCDHFLPTLAHCCNRQHDQT